MFTGALNTRGEVVDILPGEDRSPECATLIDQDINREIIKEPALRLGGAGLDQSLNRASE